MREERWSRPGGRLRPTGKHQRRYHSSTFRIPCKLCMTSLVSCEMSGFPCSWRRFLQRLASNAAFFFCAHTSCGCCPACDTHCCPRLSPQLGPTDFSRIFPRSPCPTPSLLLLTLYAAGTETLFWKGTGGSTTSTWTKLPSASTSGGPSRSRRRCAVLPLAMCLVLLSRLRGGREGRG